VRALTRLLAIPLALSLFAQPAGAQLFIAPPDFSGAPVNGSEPGIGLPIPGATPEEYGAHLLWNLRSGLNVAALQCQFAPTLRVVDNYNDILAHHLGELATAYTTLNAYFKRVHGPREGQRLFDDYSTKTYNGFSTLYAQLGFCQTAASIGRDMLFQPRGEFGALAANRMAELRQTLVGSYGEQALSRMGYIPPRLPRLDAVCWSKKGEWVAKKCGPLNWPTGGA